MADIDWDQISSLLGVVEKTVNVMGSRGQHILSEAMSQLVEIDDRIRKAKQEANGKPVTPAPLGDPDAPAHVGIPAGASEGDIVAKPVASQPLQTVDGPEKPEITEQPVPERSPAPAPAVEGEEKHEEEHPVDGALPFPDRRI